jgi:hypothetical protein
MNFFPKANSNVDCFHYYQLYQEQAQPDKSNFLGVKIFLILPLFFFSFFYFYPEQRIFKTLTETAIVFQTCFFLFTFIFSMIGEKEMLSSFEKSIDKKMAENLKFEWSSSQSMFKYLQDPMIAIWILNVAVCIFMNTPILLMFYVLSMFVLINSTINISIFHRKTIGEKYKKKLQENTPENTSFIHS